METIAQPKPLASQLVAAVALAGRLDAELDRERAERARLEYDLECLAFAYLDVFCRYRALLVGSLPAREWAAIDKAATLALARDLGARRRSVAA